MEEQNRLGKILDSLKTSLWGVGIIASVLGAHALDAFHALELMGLDRLLAATQLSLETTDKNITIVQVDPPYVDGSEKQGYTITANSLATILETVFQNEPAVVGTDIFSFRITGDIRENLSNVINQHANLITVESIFSSSAEPLSYLSSSQLKEQVGFSDLIVDRDGIVRRALLGAYDETNNNFKNSFAIQIIQKYFQENSSSDRPIELKNGDKDPDTMKFGNVEIPRITAAYGYTNREAYDIQTLINYRGRGKPFEVISASDLLESPTRQDELIKNNIVILNLVGLARDYATPLTTFTRVIDNSQLVDGTEIQAHVISQIIQAVDEQRPLIRTNKLAQYAFILFFSTLSIFSSRRSKNVLSGFIRLSVISFSSIFISYILLLQFGLWLPIAAIILAVTANGLIYINYAQNERRWKRLIEQRNLALEKEKHLSTKLALQRRQTIENIFDSIHNGPLQTLANLLRRTRDETIEVPDICLSLEALNREIRYIGDSIKQDATDEKHSLDVSYAGTKFDLDIPLQELFQEVYDAMLSRPLVGFSNLKFTIISFDPIDLEFQNIDIKRKLCRFLEEALANVGKHAVGATRLVVTGKHKENSYEITVADNGLSVNSSDIESGEGTRIGKEVEKLTHGKFIHKPNKPKGFFCQLIFPVET